MQIDLYTRRGTTTEISRDNSSLCVYSLSHHFSLSLSLVMPVGGGEGRGVRIPSSDAFVFGGKVYYRRFPSLNALVAPVIPSVSLQKPSSNLEWDARSRAILAAAAAAGIVGAAWYLRSRVTSRGRDEGPELRREESENAFEWQTNPMRESSPSPTKDSGNAAIVTPELLFGLSEDEEESDDDLKTWTPNPMLEKKEKTPARSKSKSSSAGLMQKLRRLSAAFVKTPMKKMRSPSDATARKISLSSPSRQALGYHLLDRHAMVLVNTIWEAANGVPQTMAPRRSVLDELCSAATLVQQATRHSARYEDGGDGTVSRDDAALVQRRIAKFTKCMDAMEDNSTRSACDSIFTMLSASRSLVSFAIGFLLSAECAQIRVDACFLDDSDADGRRVVGAAKAMEIATCDRIRGGKAKDQSFADAMRSLGVAVHVLQEARREDDDAGMMASIADSMERAERYYSTLRADKHFKRIEDAIECMLPAGREGDARAVGHKAAEIAGSIRHDALRLQRRMSREGMPPPVDVDDASSSARRNSLLRRRSSVGMPRHPLFRELRRMSRALHDAERVLGAVDEDSPKKAQDSGISSGVRRLSDALHSLALDEAERTGDEGGSKQLRPAGGRRDSWMDELQKMGERITELADIIGSADASEAADADELRGYVSLVMDPNYTHSVRDLPPEAMPTVESMCKGKESSFLIANAGRYLHEIAQRYLPGVISCTTIELDSGDICGSYFSNPQHCRSSDLAVCFLVDRSGGVISCRQMTFVRTSAAAGIRGALIGAVESADLAQAARAGATVNRVDEGVDLSRHSLGFHFETLMGKPGVASRVSGMGAGTRDLLIRAAQGSSSMVCDAIAASIAPSCSELLRGLRLGVVVALGDGSQDMRAATFVDESPDLGTPCEEADVIVYLLTGSDVDEGKQITFVKTSSVPDDVRRSLFLRLFMLDLSDPNLSLASTPHFMAEPQARVQRRRASVDAFVEKARPHASIKDGIFLTERRAFLFAVYHHYCENEGGAFSSASWLGMLREAGCMARVLSGSTESTPPKRRKRGHSVEHPGAWGSEHLLTPAEAEFLYASSNSSSGMSFSSFCGALQAAADKVFPDRGDSSAAIESSEQRFEHLHAQHLLPLAERIGDELLREREGDEPSPVIFRSFGTGASEKQGAAETLLAKRRLLESIFKCYCADAAALSCERLQKFAQDFDIAPAMCRLSVVKEWYSSEGFDENDAPMEFPGFADFLMYLSEHVFAFSEASSASERVQRLIDHVERLEFEVLTYDYKAALKQ